MWVKTQTVTLSVVCSAAIVVTSTAPVVPTEHPATVHTAEYRYALTAAAIDAAFNPIRYVGNVGGAAQAVASDVIYWQTPDFPLLVLSAQVDSSTGQYEAVEKVTSTAAHLQSLVSAVTAFPGASSSPQVKQLVSGIGSAGAAAAGATRTVTATLAPHLAPLTPVIYVVRVLRAAIGVYYAVATLSTTGLGSVLSGQNPLTAVANVVSSVQGLANVLTHAPRPAAAVSTGTTGESTATAAQPVAKPTAGVTRALTKGTKSEDKPEESPVSERKSSAKKPGDHATTPKPSAAPAKSKPSDADQAAATADSQDAKPATPTKKAKRAAKSDDSSAKTDTAKTDTSKSDTSKASKDKGDHGRRQH